MNLKISCHWPKNDVKADLLFPKLRKSILSLILYKKKYREKDQNSPKLFPEVNELILGNSILFLCNSCKVKELKNA